MTRHLFNPKKTVPATYLTLNPSPIKPEISHDPSPI